MNNHEKLDHATVVGVFDTQEEAEEALLRLRLAGFSGDRVGFFTRNLSGLVTDFAGKTYVVAGTVVGLILGALCGALVGYGILAGQGLPLLGWITPLVPAPWTSDAGVIFTNAVVGALLVGVCGALAGWGVFRPEAVHPGTEAPVGRFLIAVDGGDRRDEAWAIIRQHGGYDRGEMMAQAPTEPLNDRTGHMIPEM